MSTIGPNKVGIFNYTLTDENGEVLDQSDGQPMAYLHGAENIIPGLEAELAGKGVGDAFQVIVPPEGAYGEFREDGFLQVPVEHLPEDIELQPGLQLVAEDQDGNPTPIWFVTVDENNAVFTSNHPLAGRTLNFAIEIVGVRDALPIELEHGHPHGADGTVPPAEEL